MLWPGVFARHRRLTPSVQFEQVEVHAAQDVDDQLPVSDLESRPITLAKGAIPDAVALALNPPMASESSTTTAPD
jgi:hypothetical protein